MSLCKTMQFLLLFFRLHALRQNFMRTNKKRLETEVSSLFGGDKRDRTADLLNAIHVPSHFSRKTGQKGPVFSGFYPLSERQFGAIPLGFHFFGGLFRGENGRQFSPTSGGGTARKALRIKAQRAEGSKKSWENPGNAAFALRSTAVRPLIHPMWENPGIWQIGIFRNICNFSSPNRGKIRVIGSSPFTGFAQCYMRKIL